MPRYMDSATDNVSCISIDEASLYVIEIHGNLPVFLRILSKLTAICLEKYS
jgi:hypothetical protein